MTLYEETIASLAKIKGGIPVKNLSSRERIGEHKSVFRDQGMDFHQLREYDPDRDPVNRIAWNLSAQPGDDLWVREAIETKDIPTVLLADLSSSIDFGMNGELSKRKLLLECTGILALSAAHVQDRVGLVGFTDKIVIDEPAKTGVDHAYYLISRLCAFLERVPARERRGTDLLAAFAHVRERYAGSILAIVLSDCIGMEAIDESPLIARRAPNHECMFLILDDEREFEAKSRFGSVAVENRETGERAVIPMRKLSILRKVIEARREEFREALREKGIDSAVLAYGSHFEQLTAFFAERKEGS